MDRSDPDHARCRDLLDPTNQPIVVTAPVLLEVEWLATRRWGATAFDTVLASLEEGALTIHDLDMDDWRRVRGLCAMYADLPLGIVDASFIALAERLGERVVATLDRRHFGVVRTRHVPALALVPG